MIILSVCHLSLSLSMLSQFFFGHLICGVAGNTLTYRDKRQLGGLVSGGEYTVLYIYVFQYFISVFCAVL